MKPILSMNDLASRLGIARCSLRAIAGEVDRHYRSWSKKNKTTGKVRILHAPSKQLKDIQKRITRNILLKIQISPDVHGGVKGCSPRSNATPHLRRKWVANLDVRDFFPQVRHGIVLKLFGKELGFGRDVARLLTRLTTREGGLPKVPRQVLHLPTLFFGSRLICRSQRRRQCLICRTPGGSMIFAPPVMTRDRSLMRWRNACRSADYVCIARRRSFKRNPS